MVQATREAIVVDRRNMLLMWAEEKIARRELTLAQADQMVRDQETQFKNWFAPLKDGAGSAKLFFKMARDFASWKGARVVFTKSRAGHDLVIFKGWPANRKIITGTRYRLDNPKIMKLQIGKPGLRDASRESMRFGIYLVVAVDVADYLFREKATLGQLLGNLTVDIPSVWLASLVGSAAGSAVAGTSLGTALVVGTFAAGPFLVAFAVGVVAGYALYKLDQRFKIGERLGEAYDEGLQWLARAWHDLGQEAEARYRQLANSRFVTDLRRDADSLADRIGRQADRITAEIVRAW